MRERRRTVKELLVGAKDAAELMVDLAYAAVFFGDDGLAREVLRLEERMDDLLVELREVCMLATRTMEDAEQLSGVLSMAVSIEGIADAAEDIARVVLKDLGVPKELRDDLRHATEVTARVKVREENQLEGVPLKDLALPARTGMWVIALRRDVEWIYGPDGDEVLREGDVLFLQGPPEGVDAARELAGGRPHTLPAPEETGRVLSNLDRAVDLVVELKNASEVAVGLAYSAILLRDPSLAAEVGVIEDRSDDLYHGLEGWVLRAAAEMEDPEELRGLLHLAAASERIVDSAQSMTRLAEHEDPHPIIAQALAEADEIVSDAIVAEGSELEGASLSELRIHTRTGMEILAIERDHRWIYRPRSSRRLQVGDRLLAVGPEEGAPRLRVLAGDDRPEGADLLTPDEDE
ncbi:MAG: potassium channel family protein [Actinomycetes bacterium]